MTTNNLILNEDNFMLLKHLLKPSFMAIANLNFVKWISSKYKCLRHQPGRFPNLIFLLRNHFPILHRLIKNISIHPLNRDYHLNQNYFFNINISPLIALIRAKNRGVFNKQFLIKDDLERVDILNKLSPQIDITGLVSFATHPASGKQESKSIKPAHTHTEDIDNIHLSKHKRSSISGIQPISSKFTNMLITAKPESPMLSSSKNVPSFLRLFQNGWQKIYSTAKRIFLPTSQKSTDKIRPQTIPPETEPSLFNPLIHIPSDSGITDPKSGKHTKSQSFDMVFEPQSTESPAYPISRRSASTLFYAHPKDASLDDLKKSVADIDRRVTVSENVIQKSISDTSSSGNATSETSQMNINLNNLTEQVYQMLEKKMIIERERRGL